MGIGDRGEILNILYFSEDGKTNSYELAKLTNHAYSLMNRYVKDLKKLGLIKLSKGKSKGGRPALIVEKDERVKIVPYSKFIEGKDFEQSINHELYWARKSEEKFKQSLKIGESIKKAPKILKTKK